MSEAGKDPGPPTRIDTSVAHPARRYNYWLGGKDNFAADRKSGDALLAVAPTVRIAAIENRRYLRRAVAYLTRDAGIRQFLDVGAGIPAPDNTHQVAQRIAPHSRVAYVDNDPIVLSHARALLTSSPEGAVAFIDADLREPNKILRNPELRAAIDLNEPVGLMLVAVLHFIRDEEDPYGAVGELVSALPAGSYVTITHGTGDYLPAEALAAVADADTGSSAPVRLRSKHDVARFVDGLELVPPGITPVNEWRADAEPEPRPTAKDVSIYGVIARVPHEGGGTHAEDVDSIR